MTRDEVWVFSWTRKVRFFSYHEASVKTKQLYYNGKLFGYRQPDNFKDRL